MAIALSPSRLPGPSGPWVGRLALVALLVAVALLIWWAAGQQSTAIRKAQESVLVPIVPPEEVPPPVEKVEPEPVPEEVPPVPVDQPQPVTPDKPSEAPPSDAQPNAAPGNNAVSINGPAQAGSDAFGIGAGDGSGSRGGGGAGGGGGMGRFNRGAYAAYLRTEIARLVRGDATLRAQTLRVKARIWIDAAGRVTRAEIGDMPNRDKLKALLTGRVVRVPDASLEMPVIFTLDISRAG